MSCECACISVYQQINDRHVYGEGRARGTTRRKEKNNSKMFDGWPLIFTSHWMVAIGVLFSILRSFQSWYLIGMVAYIYLFPVILESLQAAKMKTKSHLKIIHLNYCWCEKLWVYSNIPNFLRFGLYNFPTMSHWWTSWAKETRCRQMGAVCSLALRHSGYHRETFSGYFLCSIVVPYIQRT